MATIQHIATAEQLFQAPNLTGGDLLPDFSILVAEAFAV
jgi:hypothetical protein